MGLMASSTDLPALARCLAPRGVWAHAPACSPAKTPTRTGTRTEGRLSLRHQTYGPADDVLRVRFCVPWLPQARGGDALRAEIEWLRSLARWSAK